MRQSMGISRQEKIGMLRINGLALVEIFETVVEFAKIHADGTSSRKGRSSSGSLGPARSAICSP